MAKLAFSAEASTDIEDIAAFSIEQFGSVVATDYLAGLERACEQLQAFPEMAAIYPRLRPDLRCLIYRRHRIFYRIENDVVLIVRVLHQARDVAQSLD